MNFLSKMPGSAKATLAVVVLCAPIVALASASQPELMKYYLISYIILCFLAGLGAFLFEKSRSKKAKGFSEDLKENASNVQGVSDPQRRREIDEMRQQFQRGIDIYKQYGKDLYSLPWFVVVGESGSGKTEALRRSEIGFPDKLQDYWQGTGGTISMHWWFTNRAVILDTAGRLFVRDNASGGDNAQNQWVSFLQMLRKNRPDCPINGLVLVIPATSLVPLEDDAADAASRKEIDAKAGQIAKQMEVLQTELGVRFPVYVLITKTDRIVGFREFFEYVESPEERYQMIGWSNSDPLGKVFDPQSVANSLRETADRLRRRRMALMKDPVPAPGRKRFDEVDSMFAFPSSFENLAPKLERYLRHIFAVDEWSSKPPFLRGIYFTSALQQGTVLDEALARALGLSLGDLERKPGEDDLSLARNRSYFLRDFFLEKVFQEKGLVTRSTKIAGKISGWKLWIPLGFASALILLGVAGWFLGRKPPGELKSWRFLAQDAYSTEHYGFHPLIVPNEKDGWTYIKEPVSSQELLRNLNQLGNQHLKSSPKFGWLFAPAVTMDGGVKEDRMKAFRIATDAIVTRPLLEAAIDGLSRRSRTWSLEGVPQSDVEAIEEIVACFEPAKSESGDDSKPRELESTTGALIRSAGLPYTTSKNRDLYRDTIGPIVSILKAAHPDGRLPTDLIDEKSRNLLAEVIGRLLSGGDGSDLTQHLEAYDTALKELQAISATNSFDEAAAKVRALNTASENLKNVEPQLNFLVTGATAEKAPDGESSESGLEQPKRLAKRLLQDREAALRQIGGSRFSTWQDLADKPEESSEVAKRRAELAKLHGLMLPDGTARNHAARATLTTEIMALDSVIPERLNLATVDAIQTSLTRLEERAKALGAEEIGKVLIGLWSDHFIASKLPQHIGFPLVFDQIRGGEERVLTRDEAAAVAALSLRLGTLSDKSRSKLSNIKAVSESIFDLEKLQKGEVAIKEWEVSLDQSTNIWFGLVSEVTVTSTRPGGGGLRWEAASGAEGKLYAADLGARLSFTDTNEPPKRHTFVNGNHESWAAVRWAVASISQGAQGASTTFGGKKITLLVKLPSTFPPVLDELPTSEKLAQ